jgi:type VI secretion system secreted protein Hcp
MPNYDIFLKIDGITGESTDPKHKGEIQLDSFALAVSYSVNQTGGKWGSPGSATWDSLNATAKSDISFPALILACYGGDRIKNAALVTRKAGKGQQEYLKITLTDVLVTNAGMGNSTGDHVPLMSFSLAFARIEIEQAPQQQSGIMGGKVKMTYDIPRSKQS